MNSEGWRELEAAGVIESKFGPVTLLRLTVDANDAASCVGFIKDEPNVRISGWSCQGDDMPARRTAVGCMLNRLILLTSGNEPKLAELFARAELRRGDGAAAPALDLGGRGNRRAKPEAARQPLIGHFGKVLVSMQLSAFGRIIVRWCGPIDLVTPCPRRLK